MRYPLTRLTSKGSRRLGSRIRLAAVSLVVVTALVGCQAITESQSNASEWGDLEITQFRARIEGFDIAAIRNETAQDNQIRTDRQHLERELQIAACMAERGFVYLPVENPGRVSIWDEANWGPGPGTREYAERWGFSVSQHDPWIAQLLANPPTDPNEELLADMSQAERSEWLNAMHGTPQGSPWEAGFDPNLAGCQMAGQAELLGSQTVADFQFFALETEMRRIPEIAARDQRAIQLNVEMGSCLADAGFPGISDHLGIANTLHSEWSLTGGTEPDQSLVSAFTEREISLAVAVFDCEQQVDFWPRREAITRDLEQQFVERNRDELEAWAAHAEAQRTGR